MELLEQWADELGLYSWSIKKAVSNDGVRFIAERTKRGGDPEVIAEIWYRSILPEYQSPFLSWKNLIFCSNNYGSPPAYDYMDVAVQEGKKTAATVYHNLESPEAQEIIKALPDDCDFRDYSKTMFFLFHKGCLADFFDFDRIKAVYDAHGILEIDWDWVAAQFQKPLSYFANEEECGFSLQSGGRGGIAVVTGLILGYPVESTVAFLAMNSYDGYSVKTSGR